MFFVFVVVIVVVVVYIRYRNFDLSGSTSIFTAEIWATINAVEQIKNSVASKYIILNSITFVSLDFTAYEAGTFPDLNLILMLTQTCDFKGCQ